ncbi:ASCH domain-containing protein [Vannielia litorea]|uniref:ASCH domain-containing protein n=1 Tax=Vannielia litorea TaxID=1217970 RepID=UPI001BCBD8F1|nr:ASCH domain-containing protein [Vannielia litorea]MBS8228179.1 ASCH domain-containing protein [Vannielia litorea]
MVDLDFLPRFALPITSGVKTSTIRRDPPALRPGAQMRLVTGLGTPACRLLLRVPCWSATRISIRRDGLFLGAQFHTGQHAHRIAQADGFTCLREMVEWFEARYPNTPLSGFIRIAWRFEDALEVLPTARARAA